MLSMKNYLVHLWCRDNLTAEYIHQKKENPKYLPGLSLSQNLQATSHLELAVKNADLLLFVSPSHATRDLAKKCAPFIPSNIPIVSATKGIENDSLMFMDEIFKEELPKEHHPHLAFLSGPSFAKELAEKLQKSAVPNKLVTVRGAGHQLGSEQEIKRMIEFFKQTLIEGKRQFQVDS